MKKNKISEQDYHWRHIISLPWKAVLNKNIMYGVVGVYSWLSLSRPRLSRITAYLEVKILSLLKHENLTTEKKNIVEKRRICSLGSISPLFHNIFYIFLISRVQLHICMLNVVVRIIYPQFWYLEVRISRSISESPLEFEIMRVDCIMQVERRRRRRIPDRKRLCRELLSLIQCYVQNQSVIQKWTDVPYVFEVVRRTRKSKYKN